MNVIQFCENVVIYIMNGFESLLMQKKYPAHFFEGRAEGGADLRLFFPHWVLLQRPPPSGPFRSVTSSLFSGRRQKAKHFLSIATVLPIKK